MDQSTTSLITLTADVVSAHVANNSVALSEVAPLINAVHDAFAALAAPSVAIDPITPAVSLRASVKPDYLVCLDCGKRVKMLKRHLRTAHDLEPDDYRARWLLPPDYPLVASTYAKARSDLAKANGLGQNGRSKKVAKSRSKRTKS